jgi:hypothetical protein
MFEVINLARLDKAGGGQLYIRPQLVVAIEDLKAAALPDGTSPSPTCDIVTTAGNWNVNGTAAEVYQRLRTPPA